MAKLENVLDMLGTMKRLRKQQQDEPDPRVREEIAYTLDLLDNSLDSILDQYVQVLAKEGKKAS